MLPADPITNPWMAWAAGLFEAEGCISPRAPGPRLIIASTDLDVIRRWGAIVAGGHFSTSIRGAKPMHAWALTRRADTVRVYASFDTFLGERRRRRYRMLAGLPAEPPQRPWSEIPSECRLAWAAGYFEGEGNFGAPRKTVVMELATMDQDMVRRFHETVGIGKVAGPYWKGGLTHAPMYLWSAYRHAQVFELFERLQPFLGERRRARYTELLSLYHPPAWASRPVGALCERSLGRASQWGATCHQQRGERPCENCRAAFRRYRAQRRAAGH